MDNVGLDNLRPIAVSKERWRIIATFLAPVILLPIAIFWKGKEGKTAYVCLLMLSCWLLELLPLAITALIPVVFFPLLGILSTDAVSGIYMKDSVLMFFGTIAIATAFKQSNLHRRIGLKLLVSLGKKTNLLTLGFMTTSAFLSMWLPNAPVAAMIISIAEGIIQELQEYDVREYLKTIRTIKSTEDNAMTENHVIYNEQGIRKIENTEDHDKNIENPVMFQRTNPTMNPSDHHLSNAKSGDIESTETDNTVSETTVESENSQLEDHYTQLEHPQKRRRKKKRHKKTRRHTRKFARPFIEVPRNTEEYKKMKRVLYLSIAYSSSIGGTITLIGTPPNTMFKRQFQKFYPGSTEITFTNWILYNFPTAVICLFLAWAYFVYFLMKEKETNKIDNEQIKREMKLQYSQLGIITFHEVAFFVVFFILALLWVFREPQFMDGWKSLFDSKIEIHSATATTAIFILLFMIPSKPSKCNESSALLKWKTLNYIHLWEIVIVIGGGFSLAKAAKESGLSKWIVSKLNIFKHESTGSIILKLTSVTLVITEIFTNTATAQMMLPIVNDMSLALKINPLYFLIPVTICCSYSFMLPAGTPTNAIAFEAAEMKIYEMIVPGIIVNILCYVTQLFMITTLGTSIFSLKKFPTWASQTQNITFV